MNLFYFQEAYSREHSIQLAGKNDVNKKWELVSSYFDGSFDDFMEFLEDLDKTRKKVLVPVFLSWFKNFNFSPDIKTSFNKFLSTISEISDELSEAVNRNVNITDPYFSVKNVFRISDFFELETYMVDVREKLNELRSKKKEKEEKSIEIENLKVAETEDFTVYRSGSQAMNCILGKGTNWCIAATKSENATPLYKQQGTDNFYIFICNERKYNPLAGEVTPLKYIFVFHTIYIAAMRSLCILFDLRTDSNDIPPLSDKLAQKVMEFTMDNLFNKNIKIIVDKFFEHLNSGKFPPIYLPRNIAEIARSMGHRVEEDEIGFKEVINPKETSLRFLEFYYVSFSKRTSRPAESKMPRFPHFDTYTTWDRKYFQPNFHPVFMSEFVPRMRALVPNKEYYSNSSQASEVDYAIMAFIVADFCIDKYTANDINSFDRAARLLASSNGVKVDEENNQLLFFDNKNVIGRL